MSGFTSQNFMKQTSPQNSFLLQTQGYVQGAMLADPVAQQWITTGLVDASATQALWPGLPVTETNPGDTAGANVGGSTVDVATAIANITSFTIANQAYNGIITNSNDVPMFAPGMSVSLVRLGSNARIVVPVDSTAVNALLRVAINTQVAWDFANNALTTFSSGTALPAKLLELNTNSKVISYNSSTGFATWSTGTVAVIQI